MTAPIPLRLGDDGRLHAWPAPGVTRCAGCFKTGLLLGRGHWRTAAAVARMERAVREVLG